MEGRKSPNCWEDFGPRALGWANYTLVMPGLYRDEGVVLRTIKLGEADRIACLGVDEGHSRTDTCLTGSLLTACDVTGSLACDAVPPGEHHMGCVGGRRSGWQQAGTQDGSD